MSRITRPAAVAIAAAATAAAVLAVPVFAADPSVATSTTAAASTTTATSGPAHWEAVTGNFARVEDARELKSRITSAGLEGFRVEVERRDGRTWFQVERPFLLRASAAADVAELHAHDFRSWLEWAISSTKPSFQTTRPRGKRSPKSAAGWRSIRPCNPSKSSAMCRGRCPGTWSTIARRMNGR